MATIQRHSTARPEAVRKQLNRLLTSKSFSGSQRMRDFLRFVVDRTLRDRGGELKEYSIGVEVFSRGPGFDPRLDPIVRVEAGRLRSRLEHYYKTEGRRDSILISVPKGGYVPRFVPTKSIDPAPPTDPNPASPSAADQPVRSIAVLPFEDHSLDQDQAYLSHGITEDIIHYLLKADGLRVIAWPGGPQRPNLGVGLEDYAAEAVLEGSVCAAGDRVRVSARLVTVPDGEYRWSETYKRDFKDIFAIQEDIARTIVNALRVQFSIDVAAPSQRRTSNIEAYKLYLKGRYHWNQRSARQLRKGIEYFLLAIQEDPDYALAYAGLADTYALFANYGLSRPPALYEKAKAAAQRAIELQPSCAEGHTSLAYIAANYDWDWPLADQEFRNAIQLNPQFATAHQWYAVSLLAPTGRLDEALQVMETAHSLDPISLAINRALAVVLYYRRDYDRALAQALRTADLEPDFVSAYWTLGLIYQQQCNFEKAEETLEKGLAAAGGVEVNPQLGGSLGQVWALSGKSEKAVSMLEQLHQLSSQRWVSPFHTALIHAALGDHSKAVRDLETLYECRSFEILSLGVDPRHDILRGDAGFQSLLTKLGLRL